MLWSRGHRPLAAVLGRWWQVSAVGVAARVRALAAGASGERVAVGAPAAPAHAVHARLKPSAWDGAADVLSRCGGEVDEPDDELAGVAVDEVARLVEDGFECVGGFVALRAPGVGGVPLDGFGALQERADEPSGFLLVGVLGGRAAEHPHDVRDLLAVSALE